MSDTARVETVNLRATSFLARARSDEGRDILRSVLALVAGWLVLVLPIFFGRSYWHRDQIRYVYPLRLYLRERLLRGEFPLWNPQLGIGRPFFSFIQPAVLDPLNVLLLLPVPFGQDLYNASHLLLAAAGTWLWLRALECERSAATLGAVVFAYGAVLASSANSLGPSGWGSAWVPWSLFLLVRASREEGSKALCRHSLYLGLCIAETLFSGDPMAVWFTLLAGFAQAMCADGAPRRRTLAALSLGAFASLGITAVQLLPALQLARELRPGGVGVVSAAQFSLEPRRLLEVITAAPWGSPFSATWRLLRPTAIMEQEPLITSLYPGVTVLPVAAFALASRPLRRTLPFAVLGGVALLLALGRHTPLWSLWYGVVVPARVFRYPEKHLVLVMLALAPLVAMGLPGVLARGRAVVFGALGASLALALAAAAAAVFARDAPELPGALMRSAALFVVVAGALHVASGRAWSRSAVAWGVAALGAFDVLSGSAEVQNWTDASVYQQPSVVMREMRQEHPADMPLRVLRPIGLRVFGGRHEAKEYLDSFVSNVGSWNGISYVPAYEPNADPRFVEVFLALQQDPVKLWRMLGVRFALQSAVDLQDLPPGSVLDTIPRYNLTVLRVHSPAERAFLATRTAAVPDLGEGLARVMKSGFDPTRHAILEGGTSGENQGSCALTADRVEALTVRCDAARDGWLIVDDAYAPGWRATVNGHARAIVRANGVLRGVPVPAGRSVTTLSYEPFGFRVGRWISLASLFACLLTIAALRRAPRGAEDSR